MEEAYISTDDPAFLAELQGVMKKLASRLDVNLLRSILVSYYATVQRAISNSAPKAIMCFLVRGTQASVLASLLTLALTLAAGDLRAPYSTPCSTPEPWP